MGWSNAPGRGRQLGWGRSAVAEPVRVRGVGGVQGGGALGADLGRVFRCTSDPESRTAHEPVGPGGVPVANPDQRFRAGVRVVQNLPAARRARLNAHAVHRLLLGTA